MPRKMKSSRRSSPPVSRRLVNSDAKLVENGFAAFPNCSSCFSSGWVATSAGPDTFARAPRSLVNSSLLLREARDFLERVVDPGRRLFQRGERRGRFFGEVLQLFHLRRELFEERREQFEVALQRAARVRGRLRDGVALDDEVRHAFAHPRERRERDVRIDRQFRQHRVLVGEDLQDLVEFLQRRVRAADHHVEVAAAAGEARAEFVEDDRQALAFGEVVDVPEQVDVDRAVGVRDRQQVLARAFTVTDLAAAAAAAACLPPAAAWARSRRTSRRSAPAGGSCSSRPSGSPGSRGW